MKLIAYLLIVANLLFVAYMYLQPKQSMVEQVQPPKQAQFNNLLLQADQLKIRRQREGSADVSLVSCASLTPLLDKEQAQQVLQRLMSKGITGRIDTDLLVEKVNYWLVLGPYSNQMIAQARANELKEQDIDSYLVPSGKLKNAISLGVFSTLKRAQAQKMTLEVSSNIKGEIKEVEKTRAVFQLQFDLRNSNKLDQSVIDLLQKDFNLIKKQKKPC